MSRKLGLVIGNSAYRDSTLARLETPDVDVGDLSDVLLDPEIGGFDDVKVLFNASSNIVRRAISTFFAAKHREDLLLLYFSGHGVLDMHGRLFLAVKDTERQLLRATAIPSAFVTDEMNNSRSQRQLLILDCCHSGAFARGSKGSVGASVGTSSAFEGTGYGRVVMTATDATQYAWEGDKAIGTPVTSVFTNHLIRGLKSGEADANNDGVITVDELYDYAYGQVVRETPEQTPGKWTYKEQGEIVIAHNPRWRPISVADVPPSELDEDVDRQLASLYTSGLSAYWLEEWEKAAAAFNAIVEQRADYKDAATKLAEARQQQKLKRLYMQGKVASEKGDWQGAVDAFKNLQSEMPDYKDASQLLAAAEQEKRLADLYAEAQHLYQAKQYPAVLKVFENLAAERPGFEDPDGLLEKAKAELQAVEKQRAVEAAYRDALQALESGRLEQARRLLAQVQAMAPGYEDAERLLRRIESELAPPAETGEESPAPAGGLVQAASSGIAAITRLLNFEAVRSWLGSGLARPVEAPAGRQSRPSEEAGTHRAQTTVTAGLTEGVAWRVLMISAGWFVAFLFHYYPTFESIPNWEFWFNELSALSGWRLDNDGVGFVLLCAIVGLLAGATVWIAMRSIRLPRGWRNLAGLMAAWLVAFTLAGFLAMMWRESVALTGWLMAGLVGGAIGGLSTGLILRQPGTEPRVALTRMVLGGALGLGSGFFIAELLGGPLMDLVGEGSGWLLSRRIGNVVAGVVVGWFLLDEGLANDGLGIRWRTVALGAGGYFLAALPLNLLFRSVWISDNAFLIYLGLLGFTGTAVMVMPSREPKRIVTLGLLGGAGLVLGHILLLLVTGDVPELLAPAFWGFGLGAALGISTRKLPVAIMMGLLSLAGSVLTYNFLLSFFAVDESSAFLIALVIGIYGGFVAFLYECFARWRPVSKAI